MALHRLTSITMGVPDVAETARYYSDFGLTDDGGGWFTTRDAGRQLRIVPAPTRRLVEVRIGVDDPDDLAAAAAHLQRLGIPVETGPAASALIPAPRGPRRPHDRQPQPGRVNDPIDPTPGEEERAMASGLVHLTVSGP